MAVLVVAPQEATPGSAGSGNAHVVQGPGGQSKKIARVAEIGYGIADGHIAHKL